MTNQTPWNFHPSRQSPVSSSRTGSLLGVEKPLSSARQRNARHRNLELAWCQVMSPKGGYQANLLYQNITNTFIAFICFCLIFLVRSWDSMAHHHVSKKLPLIGNKSRFLDKVNEQCSTYLSFHGTFCFVVDAHRFQGSFAYSDQSMSTSAHYNRGW